MFDLGLDPAVRIDPHHQTRLIVLMPEIQMNSRSHTEIALQIKVQEGTAVHLKSVVGSLPEITAIGGIEHQNRFALVDRPVREGAGFSHFSRGSGSARLKSYRNGKLL
jgi:hypothetical protein